MRVTLASAAGGLPWLTGRPPLDGAEQKYPEPSDDPSDGPGCGASSERREGFALALAPQPGREQLRASPTRRSPTSSVSPNRSDPRAGSGGWSACRGPWSFSTRARRSVSPGSWGTWVLLSVVG